MSRILAFLYMLAAGLRIVSGLIWLEAFAPLESCWRGIYSSYEAPLSCYDEWCDPTSSRAWRHTGLGGSRLLPRRLNYFIYISRNNYDINNPKNWQTSMWKTMRSGGFFSVFVDRTDKTKSCWDDLGLMQAVSERTENSLAVILAVSNKTVCRSSCCSHQFWWLADEIELGDDHRVRWLASVPDHAPRSGSRWGFHCAECRQPRPSLHPIGTLPLYSRFLSLVTFCRGGCLWMWYWTVVNFVHEQIDVVLEWMLRILPQRTLQGLCSFGLQTLGLNAQIPSHLE